MQCNGHLNVKDILRREEISGGHEGIVYPHFERVLSVIWNRCFIEVDVTTISGLGPMGHVADKIVGLSPASTRMGDIIAILFGCSIPVILRPLPLSAANKQQYEFVSEAFIYGYMDGEIFDQPYEQQDFILV